MVDVLVNTFTIVIGQLVVDDWFLRNLPDRGVSSAVKAAMLSHGSITRADLLNSILPAVTADGAVSAAELTSLQNIDAGAGKLGESDDVRYLLMQAANRTPAGPASTLQSLVGKYFLGQDHPAWGIADDPQWMAAWANWQKNYGTVSPVSYQSFLPGPGNSYTLFGAAGPYYTDVHQGGSAVGDCTFMAAFAEVAYRQPQAIRSMFIDNGDGTYAVRFYVNHQPVYVTVDWQLPALPNGSPIYAQVVNGGVLWPALLEKAYAQFNGTGLAGTLRNGSDSYWALDTGTSVTSMNVLEAITNRGAFAAPSNITGIDVYRAWAGGQLATVGTGNADGLTDYGQIVCHDHQYAVLGASPNGTLLLYNPWGQDGRNDRNDLCNEYVLASPGNVGAYFTDWGFAASPTGSVGSSPQVWDGATATASLQLLDVASHDRNRGLLEVNRPDRVPNDRPDLRLARAMVDLSLDAHMGMANAVPADGSTTYLGVATQTDDFTPVLG